MKVGFVNAASTVASNICLLGKICHLFLLPIYQISPSSVMGRVKSIFLLKLGQNVSDRYWNQTLTMKTIANENTF